MLVVEPFDVLQHGISTLSVACRKILTALGEETLGRDAIRIRTGYSAAWTSVCLTDLVKRELVKKEGAGPATTYTVNRLVDDQNRPVDEAESSSPIVHSGPPLRGQWTIGGSVDGTKEEEAPWWDKD